MRQNITKKAIIEGAMLAKDHGYWSVEVREFLEGFIYPTRLKLCHTLHTLYNGHNPQASEHYNMLLEKGLI